MVQASPHNEYRKAEFNPAQIKVIDAICNAVFQAHEGREAEGILEHLPDEREEWQAEAAKSLVGKSWSDLPGATDKLLGLMGRALSKAVLAELSTALTLLSTTAGTFFLAYGYRCPFYDIPLKEREEVLKSWMTSKLEARRKIVRAFAVLALYTAYTYIPECADATGYPSPDRRQTMRPLKAPAFRYTFLTPPAAASADDLPVIDTEVLIIGSGAGGGVVASVLSRGADANAKIESDGKVDQSDAGHHDAGKGAVRKGLKCLVIEKGRYAPTGEKFRSQEEGFLELYQQGAVISSESGSISVLAASVFGGGTTINWSGSLKTQHYVREAWAKQYGLTHFLTNDFQQSLESVCDRMGVSTQYIKHNASNSRLVKGSQKLGYHIDAIPQNTDGNEHACGFCTLGCPYGEKQGTVETFMKDAAAAGTQFMQETNVVRLLFSTPDDPMPTITKDNLDEYKFSPTHTRCVGAELVLGDGTHCIARASKTTVVSGGSINSPAILLRSGLKNPNIGKNLHLHPASFVSGYFKEQIKPWEGSIMTAVSNVHENRAGSTFGAKVEVNTAFPGGQASLAQTWTGSAAHKAGMLEHNHKFTMISLTRDRDSGRVVIDETGHPRVHYDISPFDAESCLRGIMGATEVMLAAGAKRICTAQAGVPAFEVPDDIKGVIDPRFQAWMKQVEEAGVRPGWTSLATAHQMGTCCMGVSPKSSVIDPRGRVWETTDNSLYVADASTFPTASGVNPMITTMSVSHSIAKFILEDVAAAA